MDAMKGFKFLGANRGLEIRLREPKNNIRQNKIRNQSIPKYKIEN
jgi:hypothetical protein